jgi:hypothetical protein
MKTGVVGRLPHAPGLGASSTLIPDRFARTMFFPKLKIQKTILAEVFKGPQKV